MEIQQVFVDEMLKFAESYGKKAIITVGGVEREYTVFKTTIEGNEFKKMVFIDDVEGHITNARMVDAMGRNLYVKEYNIVKGPDGFMVLFRMKIIVEGA